MCVYIYTHNAKAEAPIPWPPDAEPTHSDPDAGKD